MRTFIQKPVRNNLVVSTRFSPVSLGPTTSSNVCTMNAQSVKWRFFAAVFLFNIFVDEIFAQYVPPTPSVEPLYPKGLRISLAHEDGISLVAYHVKFNDDFNGLEAGTIARDITRMRNGRWTYEDRTTRLKRGDIIYYWMHVVYDGLGYNLLDQQHVVNDFYSYDGTPVGGTSDVVCASPSETKIFENDPESEHLKRHNVCPDQLLFEENFDILNTSRWQVVERFSGTPHYEFVVYMNNNENIEVKDGALHIKPVLMDRKYQEGFVQSGELKLERCTGEPNTPECNAKAFGSYILPPVISGRLNSKSSFNFLYGRIQIRAKLPRGDWLYPLITLESAQKNNENSTDYCDIIVALAVGNPSLKTQNGYDLGGHNLLAGAHTIQINTQTRQVNQLDLPRKTSNYLWSNDYHVYDLEWKSGRIAVKVDGEQYGEQRVPALYDTPVYINIGLAVGGLVVFPDSTISGNYAKPWRNVESKALLSFYQAQNKWIDSWRNSDTGLHIDYIKAISICLVLVLRVDRSTTEPVGVFSLIHDLIQYNIAGVPLIHEHTQWDFDPEVGKQRRVRYEQENGRHGEIAIAKIGMGIGYKGPWGTTV